MANKKIDNNWAACYITSSLKQEDTMATKKLITRQFTVTLVEYVGPDAESTTAEELEETIADKLCDSVQGTVMVHEVGKPRVLAEGRA